MKISFLEPSNELPPYCWLVKIGERKLGVHQSDGWCMELDDKLVFFSSEDTCVPLSPILEIEGRKFTDFLKSAVVLNPRYSECIKQFPKKILLKHVFHTSFSGYWPEKALAWLAEDEDLHQSFRYELEKFIQNKVMPQSARQKAKKIFQNLSLT